MKHKYKIVLPGILAIILLLGTAVPKTRAWSLTDLFSAGEQGVSKKQLKSLKKLQKSLQSIKIKLQSIGEPNLKDNTISSLRLISDDLIISEKIKDGTLTDADISPDTKISSSKLDLTDYAMANLPTDSEKSKIGEMVDSSDSSIALGNKNISQIHDQNTDTATNSQTFTIGATGQDLHLNLGSSARAFAWDQDNGYFTLNQDLSLSSNQIKDLATPTDNSDAATKGYVDNQLSTEINNLKWKDPVDAFADLPPCGSSSDGHARLVLGENWIYRCDDSDDTWHKVANVGTVNHAVLQNRDAADSHPASAITNTAAGDISATTVQAALNELDTEKFKLAPSADQEITYGGQNARTTLRMHASQSAAPLRIITSGGSDSFVVGTNGRITTSSVDSASIVDGSIAGGDLATNLTFTTTGSVTALAFASTQTTGTAPFTVASVTKVANLNADLLDDLNTSATGGASVVPITDASGNFTLTNGKVNLETAKFESETSAPTAEEGKIYYNSTDKTAKIYNTQATASGEYLDIPADPHIQPSNCPDGYVPVPGDSRYGTGGGFCVMKYEAKCDFTNDGVGDTTPATAYQTYDNNSQACTTSHVKSLATGFPIANITQTNSISYCSGLGTGYHLITNSEWMTIARNAERIGANWTSGTVGTNGLYRGHTDNVPATALAANADDSQGYEGTGQSAPSEQRRTFILSNNETLWDISGNVWEWNLDTIKRKDEPHSTAGSNNTWGWKEFDTIDNYGKMNYANMRPGNPAWKSTQNAGQLYTYNPSGDTDATIYAFLRGGYWSDGSDAGLFALALHYAPGDTHYGIGFRCVFRQ